MGAIFHRLIWSYLKCLHNLRSVVFGLGLLWAMMTGYAQTNDAVLDQYQAARSSSSSLRANETIAQTFQPGLNGRLVMVQLPFSFPQPPEIYPIRISIVETVEGVPRGRRLGSFVISDYWNTLSYTNAVWDVPITSNPVYLRKDVSYGIQFETDSPFAGIDFQSHFFDGYTRGMLWYQGGTNDWEAARVFPQDPPTSLLDLVFYTWMEPGIPPIYLTSPLSRDLYIEGDTVQVRADLGGPNAEATVEFFQGETSLGADSEPPFEVFWNEVPAGEYSLSAVLTEAGSLVATSEVFQVSVAGLGPPGDRFSERLMVGGEFLSLMGTNTGASSELGEPSHAPDARGSSIWWSWSTVQSGPAYFTLHNSGTSNLVAALYRGSTVDSLVPHGGGAETFFFEAIAGVEYQIAVDSVGDESSEIVLDIAANDIEIASPFFNRAYTAPADATWSVRGSFSERVIDRVEYFLNGDLAVMATEAPFDLVVPMEVPGYYDLRAESVDARGVRTRSYSRPFSVRPENDNYANAIELSGYLTNVVGHTSAATKQAGEPSWADNQGQNSIWYAWTAPASGACRISGTGPGTGLLLTVITGTSLSSYQIVAFNAHSGGPVPVSFQAIEGSTYHISVAGYAAEEGEVELMVLLTPPNDALASATLVREETYAVQSSNFGATQEPGEPEIEGYAQGRTVWWRWRAPASGKTSIICTSELLDPVVSIFAGSKLEDLQLVTRATAAGGSMAEAVFHAEAGANYFVSVDGTHLEGEDFELSLAMSLLRILSIVSGTLIEQPETLRLEVGIPPEAESYTSLAFYSGTTYLGTAPGSSTRWLWQNPIPGSHRLWVRGSIAGGGEDSSVPSTILIYTNDVLPQPKISAGYLSSYALTAVGELYVWGKHEYGDWGIPIQDESLGCDPFDPFCFQRDQNLNYPEPARYPAGVTEWKQAGNWDIGFGSHDVGLGNNGLIYLHGVEEVPMPSGISRWVWIHEGFTIGDNGDYYHQGQLAIPQGEPGRWSKIKRTLHLSHEGELFYRGGTTFDPIPFPQGVSAWADMEEGWNHYLALTPEGQLYAWGFNYSGQLGLGHNNTVGAPTLVVPPNGVEYWTRIAAGGNHTLALADTGELYAWGRNWESQLGIGDSPVLTANRSRLVAFPDQVTAWTDIAAGYEHSMAVGNDCQLYTWGSSSRGQLGLGAVPPQPVPTRVNGLGLLCGVPIIHANAATSILPDGSYQLEFGTVLNRQYHIQYSSNHLDWISVSGSILGTGQTAKWVDRGPPDTESHPSSQSARFYRVLHVQ